MHCEGVLIGLASFVIIGFFHPVVVICERQFTYEIWPLFLCAGLLGLACAAVSQHVLWGAVLGVFGFSCLWSIKELFEQRERVRKGWFPAKDEAGAQLRSAELPKLSFTGQAIGESAFDVLYLAAVLLIAAMLNLKPGHGMALAVLFIGDACHLLPRMYALTHGGADKYPVSLGIGKFVASITMSVFYYLLAPNAYMFALLCARIVICLLPMNKWAGAPSAAIGIARNAPLVIMGAIAAYTLGMPYAVAIVFSFLFYIPVILFSNKNPRIGMLMLPKSCAYIALALMLWIN